MTHPLEQLVSDFLKRQNLAKQEILLGFSGGADSTALLMLLKKADQTFRAVHFEHGIRGAEALREADWCRNFCADKQVPFDCISLHVPERTCPGEGIEEAARRLRLQEWHRLNEMQNRPVLLAHHLDDCLENFLLRLGRGAGSSGLTGLREFRRMGNLRIYRPLLGVRREELEGYLRFCGIEDWCCDSSNSDVVYRRNAVRHELLPLWRRIFCNDGNLVQSMGILSEEAAYLEERAGEAFAALSGLESWRRISGALLPRVLRLWWRKQTGQDRVFSCRDISALRCALQERSGSHRRLFFSGAEEVMLTAEGPVLMGRQHRLLTRCWHWQENPRLEMPEIGRCLTVLRTDGPVPPGGERFRQDSLDEILIVRCWEPGDRIRPFGADFHKKLKELWQEAGIPLPRRTAVPVILSGPEIIWIPGVRRAEFGRVGSREEESVILLLEDISAEAGIRSDL